MAIINCPECGKQVSDKAEVCPHCGYKIQQNLNNDEEMLKTNLFGITASSIFKSRYDVVLVDYIYNNFRTASYLKKVLDIPYLDTLQLLKAAPVYLYNDVEYDDALYVCRQLKNIGIVTAIADPFRNIKFYAPLQYNKPFPSIDKINRKPWLVKKPKKIDLIEPIGPQSDTYTVYPIGGSNHPGITHNGTVTIVNNGHNSHSNNQYNTTDTSFDQQPQVTIVSNNSQNTHSLHLGKPENKPSNGTSSLSSLGKPENKPSQHSLKPKKK